MDFAKDISQIRAILRFNAVHQNIDEEVLISMLELYKFDHQRVDLVILELELMLGKELSVGAQGKRQGVAAADLAENSEESKEKVKALSISFHKSILDAIPNVNIKFAAFKATEFSKSCGAKALWKEFLGRTLTDPSQKIPRMGTPWNLPEAIDPEHERLYQFVYDHYLSVQVEFLFVTLPDADPSFLEKEVKKSKGDQKRIQNFLSGIMEGKIRYPTRAEYNKMREYNELANKFFTVEEFLELYADPIQHLKCDKRITDKAYRYHALAQLKVDFKSESLIVNIKKVFGMNNFHYTPTYMMLSDQLKQMKVRRQVNEAVKIKTKDLFLIQEVAFVRLLPQIQTYLVNKVKMREEALAISRSNGTLLDCPVCYEDELIGLDFTYCPMGHGTCKNCVRRQTEELIGLMKNHVPCLYPDCPSEYTLSALKDVLKKSIFDGLERRKMSEEILVAGIEGLESCPFCDYCEVPRETDSQFECKNPNCKKTSCRLCREVNHVPLTCHENFISLRCRHYVEEEMTSALVRKCPKCKKSFVKSYGCNQVDCVCGTKICYMCGAEVKSSDHFYRGEKKRKPGKCPFYCVDTPKLHEEEVAMGAKRAQKDLERAIPRARVNLVLEKKF